MLQRFFTQNTNKNNPYHKPNNHHNNILMMGKYHKTYKPKIFLYYAGNNTRFLYHNHHLLVPYCINHLEQTY